MPGETVIRSLRHIWLSLEPMAFPMAVMGGLALAAWRHVRATRDVDLLIGAAAADVDSLVDHLRAAGIRPKRSPIVTRLGQFEIMQFLYEPAESFLELQIDLMPARSEYQVGALHRRVETRLPDLDIPIAVLACEDLILHKILAGRLIDLADAAALVRYNRGSLDWNYLSRWSRQLDVAEDLARVQGP